jgi:hypothetical protein
MKAVLIAAGIIAITLVAVTSCTTLKKEARAHVRSLPEPQETGAVITEADLAELPPVVRRYFEFSQVLGKPKIGSFAFVMRGRIRNGADGEWMPFVARQYNHLTQPARIYYIKGKGPMSGLDSYINGTGQMRIKLFNLITIADSHGPEMDQSGLVTFLNDLLFCPTAYFSVPVAWEQIDERSARLSLPHGEHTVSAVVTFDEEGRPVNWRSDDRYADVDGNALADRWSTPMHEFAEVNGLRIPVRGEGIHNYNGTEFVYAVVESITSLQWDTAELPPVE